MTAPTNPLNNLLKGLLSNVVNVGLNLDPHSKSRLAQYEGRRLGIELTFPPDQSCLVIEQGELHIQPGIENCHVLVRGSLPVLGAWLLAAGQGSSPPPGSSVHVEGDITVLQEFERMFKAFSPSITEPLEKIVGANRADEILGFRDLAQGVLKSAGEAVSARVSQGLNEQFVNESQLNAFLDDLSDLQLRIDRLSANIKLKEDAQRHE